MALSFGQLFNSQSLSGGNIDNPKKLNKKDAEKVQKEFTETKKQEPVYRSGSGEKYPVSTIEVYKNPKDDGTHIKGWGVEDYSLEKNREDKSGYDHLGILPREENIDEEYTLSEKYSEYKSEQGKKGPRNNVVSSGDKLIDSLISNDKVKRIESLKKNNILEVTYNNISTIYNIEDMHDDKIKYTTSIDPKPRETTMDSLRKIILGPGVAFAVIGEKEKLQLREFDLMVEAIKEKEKVFDKADSTLEQIEHMRDLLEEYSIPIAYIEPIISKKEKAHQERLQEQARRYYEEREEAIENIGKILENGVDKIVIHGNTVEKGDYAQLEAKFAENIDLDTRGALFLFSLANGVKYNEGSYTELTKKGQKGSEGVFFNNKKEKDQTTLYIDTSGEQLDYEVGSKGTKVFIDHHQKHFSKYATSATELAYEVLVKNNMLEREPWMDKLVGFVTSIDNLTYANHEKFNEDFLEHKWPKSMYSIYKNVPFDKITEWFKGGKNPLNPEFTEEELNEVIKVKVENGLETKFTLKDLIEQKKKEIGLDIRNAKLATKVMESRGLKIESPRVGKVIYNKQDRQKDILKIDKDRNPTNKIYNGFLVAKALGYDTYATYNEKYSRFMINTNTYDLYPTYENLKEIVPGAVLVRGVMLMQPPGISNRKDITEDKFLEVLGLKDK